VEVEVVWFGGMYLRLWYCTVRVSNGKGIFDLVSQRPRMRRIDITQPSPQGGEAWGSDCHAGRSQWYPSFVVGKDNFVCHLCKNVETQTKGWYLLSLLSFTGAFSLI